MAEKFRYKIRRDKLWVIKAAKISRIVFYPIIVIWHLFDPEVEL